MVSGRGTAAAKSTARSRSSSTVCTSDVVSCVAFRSVGVDSESGTEGERDRAGGGRYEVTRGEQMSCSMVGWERRARGTRRKSEVGIPHEGLWQEALAAMSTRSWPLGNFRKIKDL
eukprot:181095-Rhodomonas_salina.1